MKRLFSIAFLLLFLFNVVGYYGVYLGLRHQFDQEFVEKMNTGEYPGGGALIVKIPFSLPYPVNFDGYEKVDGEFEYQGKFYRLVGQRVVGDTLYVSMIKNEKEGDLRQSFVDFAKASNDVPTSKSTLKIIQQLTKEFISKYSELEVVSPGWCKETKFGTRHFQTLLRPSSILSPPPENILS